MLGARKKPHVLKKICPKADDVLCCSFFALEIKTPKQVGTIVAPRSKRAHRPIENWITSYKKNSVTPATVAREANPQQMAKACT